MANPNPKPPPKHSQWKKGQSGNPLGGKLHDPLTKALRKLTLETYREIIEIALTGDVDALREIASDNERSVVQVSIARALLLAMKRGDAEVLEKFAARIVGKIPEKIEVDMTSVNAQAKSADDLIKIKKAMKKFDDEF